MSRGCCSSSELQLSDILNSEFSIIEVNNLFKMLAHPIRRHILQFLLIEPELCTCDLTHLFQEEQPIITKHLSLLVKYGLLTYRSINILSSGKISENNTGKWTAYRIKDTKLTLLRQLLTPFTKKR